MSLDLHTLQPAVGSKKRRKRVGRGNASGHGTYSTRGIKGQRARTGGKKGLRMFGIKTTIQNIPKHRGFKSHHQKLQLVNLDALERIFESGTEVTLEALSTRGLISDQKRPVKVLGRGTLTKSLQISAHAFSKRALEMIEQAGGKGKLIPLV